MRDAATVAQYRQVTSGTCCAILVHIYKYLSSAHSAETYVGVNLPFGLRDGVLIFLDIRQAPWSSMIVVDLVDMAALNYILPYKETCPIVKFPSQLLTPP